MLHVSRNLTFSLAICLSLFLSLNIYATKIGYSGRLVQTDGSPITGTPDLKFDLYHTDDLGNPLDTVTVVDVPLSNGIYTVELDFPNIADHVKNTLVGESLVIQVTDLDNGLVFDTQKVLATPVASYAITAESIADQAITPSSLDFIGSCGDNQILIKSGTQFDCINQTAALTVDATLVNNAGVLGQAVLNSNGTYSSVTVDQYGRVTGGSNPEVTSSQIQDGSITDADIDTNANISWSKISYPTIDKNYVGLGNVANVAQIPASDLDNSGTLDSATQVPSELAVKGYVDTTAQTIADAKVIDDMSGAETTTAPSVNSVKNYVIAQTGSITSSQWTTSGSDIYYNTGKIGVGTSSPYGIVDVDAGSFSGTVTPLRSVYKATVSPSSSNGYSLFEGTGGTTYSSGTVYGLNIDLSGGTSANHYGVYLNGENRNYFSGRVGIGTSTPTQKLTVDGNINVTTSNDICIDGGTCLSSAVTSAGEVNTSSSAGGISLVLPKSGTDLPFKGLSSTSDIALTANANDVQIGVSTSNSANELLRLDGSGRLPAMDGSLVTGLDTDQVAEGTNQYFTTTRAQTASVVNSTAGTETTQAASVSAMKNYVLARATQWTTSGSDIYYNSGNVGIGTSSPSTKLHVDNGASSADVIVEGNEAHAHFVRGSYTVGSQGLKVGVGSSNQHQILTLSAIPLRLGTDDTERMRIDATGNVGIGTTAPAATLDVNGLVKMKKNSAAPQACTATIDGTMAMTTAYGLCVCRSSVGWVSMTDGSRSCPWSGYNIVSHSGGRIWSDGKIAKSCNEYRNPKGLYQYSGATGDGTYTIDPDGDGMIAPFNVTCDMTTDGGGWTAITQDLAKNTLGAQYTELDACTISWSGNLIRSRDGSGDCSTHYDIPFAAGFSEFYLSGYQVQAYAADSSDMGSTSPITTWNSRWGAADDGTPSDGDVAWGSASDSSAAVSWISSGSPSFSCTSCTNTFSGNGTIYSVGAYSNTFRIEWGEGGGEAEGWYPWRAGTIYLR